MNRKSTAALATVAIALFAFIVLHERHTLSSGELEGRSGRLLERFVRNRVDAVRIERPEQPALVLTHHDSGEFAADDPNAAINGLGHWTLDEPIAAEVDEDAVFSMLGAMEWADARRTLEGISAEDAARYGFDAPRLLARFEVADETLELRFGEDDPTGVGLYLSIGDGNAYVVGRDVFEALDHDASHFRAKRLLRRGVLNATGLSLPSAGLEKNGAGWQVTFEELTGRASQGRVEEALQSITDLQAERFVEVAEFVALSRIVASGEFGEVVIGLSGTCVDHPEETLVEVHEGETRTHACVLTSALDALTRPGNEWREWRAITGSDLELSQIVLTNGGRALRLEKGEEGWTFVFDRDGTVEEGNVDGEALADWLRELRDIRGTSLVPADDAALAAHGLVEPEAQLVLRNEDGEREILRLGTQTLEGAYLRRGQESGILVAPLAVVSLLEANTLRLRPRDVASFEADAFDALWVQRNGVPEHLEKAEHWQVLAPIMAPANDAAVEGIGRAMASLRALRFVAEVPAEEHGLATPRFEVEARFGAQRLKVLVGAPAEGGAYAQVEGRSAVFVVGESFVADLAHPLASRRLLSTSAVYLERIAILRGEERIALRHDGASWSLEEGGAIADEAVADLVDGIETLRARATTAYGVPTAETGLGAPRIRLEIGRSVEGGTPANYVVAIGSPAGDGRVFAQREDLDVGFVVDGAFVDLLEGFSAP